MSVRSATVAARLAQAFGATIAVLGSVIVIGLVKMSQVEDRLVDIAEQNTVVMRHAYDMRVAVNQVAIQTRNMAVQKDDALVREELQAMGKSRERYDDDDKQLEQMFATLPDTTAEERELFKKTREWRDTVRPLNNKLIELRKAGNMDEMAAFLANEVATPQTKWLQSLGALTDCENRLNTQAAADARRAYSTARLLMFVLTGAGLLVAAFMAARFARSLRRELGGEPAYATAIAQSIAEGNLTVAVHTDAGDETSLVSAMKRMQQSLSGIVTGIRSGAESIATGSSQIASGNADLSQRTEEQASNLEQTAASMEELAGTVSNNAETARQAAQLVSAATEAADRGAGVVRDVVGTMGQIQEASVRITDIIGVIDGIAFQTNILALNAAVEAARAGEQGRGFAVVAGEVRSLASRSSAAAREIKQLIVDSGEKVQQGVTQVGAAGDAMTEIHAGVRRVNDLIGEIDTASAEQSRGITQVGEAVSQLDQVTQQNAALVEESAAAAESLKVQADRLVQSVAAFRVAA